MIITMGNDPATAGAAQEMAQKQGNLYGPIVNDSQQAKAQLINRDSVVNIVSHCEAVNNLNGQTVQQVAQALVGTWRLFDNKDNAAKKIYLHACYSDGFAQNLQAALLIELQQQKKPINYIEVYGTDGLNVLDLDGKSRVLQPDAFGDTPADNWQVYEDLIKGGKISSERWTSTIKPKLQAEGKGWNQY